MSYQHALQTLQWSTHIEVDEPDGSTYFDGTDFEPSKELEQRILQIGKTSRLKLLS